MTDEIERIASEYIAKIDDMGGAVKAIEQGYIQREIADSSYNYQKAMEAGDQIVVGVNKFQIEEPPAKGLLRVEATVADHQIAKLHKMKEGRDNVIVKQRLEALRAAAATDANLMHYILDLSLIHISHHVMDAALAPDLRVAQAEQLVKDHMVHVPDGDAHGAEGHRRQQGEHQKGQQDQTDHQIDRRAAQHAVFQCIPLHTGALLGQVGVQIGRAHV